MTDHAFVHLGDERDGDETARTQSVNEVCLGMAAKCQAVQVSNRGLVLGHLRPNRDALALIARPRPSINGTSAREELRRSMPAHRPET